MRRIVVVMCAIGLLGVFGQIEGVVKAEKHFLIAQEASATKASPSEAGARAQPELSAPAYADVAKIFSKYNCGVCHGETEPRGGISLANYKNIMRGGKHGPVIKAGEPGKSELIRRLKGLSEPRMPYGGPPWLTEDEIATIERWILSGAPEGE
jgi:hypothetical protein